MAVAVPPIQTPSRRLSAKTQRDPRRHPSNVVTPVVGTAADLDFVPNAEKLKHTWDLIESGAVLTAEPIDVLAKAIPDAVVQVTLNGAVFSVPAKSPISLQNLGLAKNHFLFIDDAFVRTKDGETRVTPKQGMKVEVEPYPAHQPLAWAYWSWGNYVPDRAQIARTLKSPWGRTLINGVNSLILSLLARPGISSSSSASHASLVVSVISGAKMLDLMLKDTLLRLLTDAALHTTHVLFSLFVCELCFIVSASVDLFACFRLLEYHAIPTMLLAWVFVRPALHRTWCRLAPTNAVAGCVAVLVPLAIAVVALAIDVDWRQSVSVDNIRSCAVARDQPYSASEGLGRRKERVML